VFTARFHEFIPIVDQIAAFRQLPRQLPPKRLLGIVIFNLAEIAADFDPDNVAPLLGRVSQSSNKIEAQD
jgi:hypothetical protein